MCRQLCLCCVNAQTGSICSASQLPESRNIPQIWSRGISLSLHAKVFGYPWQYIWRFENDSMKKNKIKMIFCLREERINKPIINQEFKASVFLMVFLITKCLLWWCYFHKKILLSSDQLVTTIESQSYHILWHVVLVHSIGTIFD